MADPRNPCDGNWFPEPIDKDGNLIPFEVRNAFILTLRGLYAAYGRLCLLENAAPAAAAADTAPPGAVTFTADLLKYGMFSITVLDIVDFVPGSTEVHIILASVDETTMDLYGTLPVMDGVTDPITVTITESPELALRPTPWFNVGDYVLIEDTDDNGDGRRKSEAGKITVVNPGDRKILTIKRAFPGAAAGNATFESPLTSHAVGKRLYKLELKHFVHHTKEQAQFIDASNIEDFPDRIDLPWSSFVVAAAMVSAANAGGFGPWDVQWLAPGPTADPEQLPPPPGLRTLAGQALIASREGDLVVNQTSGFPIPVQDLASIRTINACVLTPPTGAAILIETYIDYGAGPQLMEALTIPDGALFSWPASNPPAERQMPYATEWRNLQILKQDARLSWKVTQVGSSTPGGGLTVVWQT